MQTRSWLVAALLVAWAGVAQPVLIIATGGAAALLGAATLGASAVGAGVLGAGAIAAAKASAAAAVGKGVVGAAALGASKAVIAKAGLAKAGFGKAGLTKAGLAKGGIAKAGLSKAGLAKGGLAKANLAKDSLVKASLIQASLDKASLAKGDLARVGLGTALSSSSSGYGSNVRSGRYGGSTSIRLSTRYRREVPSYTAEQEMLLHNAFALDQEKPCGLRLVCELATRSTKELAEDERLIMSLLQKPHSVDSMAVPYTEAALLGRSSPSGTDACAQVYHRCGFDAIQIMQLLRRPIV